MTAATIAHHPACPARDGAACTCPTYSRRGPSLLDRARTFARSLADAYRAGQAHLATLTPADLELLARLEQSGMTGLDEARLLHPAAAHTLAHLGDLDGRTAPAEVVLTGCGHPAGRHGCPWHQVHAQANIGALVARNGWRLAQRSDGRDQCGTCTTCTAPADEAHEPTCPEYDRAVLREVHGA